MGVNIKDLTVTHPISIGELSNKVLAVDGFNLLYQFITTIRGPDGSPLTDSSGRVTSHLQGLFSRTSNLLSNGIKLVFVFDGEPPALKRKEIERRKALKMDAKSSYEDAAASGDLDAMRKFAGRTSFLSKEVVDEAKILVSAMGQPVVQAPSEGEAQMARIVKDGHAWAGVSQDYDSLLYCAPRLVRNLSILGKRKLPGKAGWKYVEPEFLDLKENLSSMGLTEDQLLCLAILVGTDYNYGGIKGIGPKKALEHVRKAGSDPTVVFSALDFDAKSEVPWKDIWDTFKNMPVKTDYNLKWGGVDSDAIRSLLVKEHNFSVERVDATIENLSKHVASKSQRSLADF
jgi:flap structure-specific endonuclease